MQKHPHEETHDDSWTFTSAMESCRTTASTMTDSALEDEFEDRRLSELFSTFDEVRASEQLIQETLDTVASPQATDDPVRAIKTNRGTTRKTRRRAKPRLIRIAAVAACIAALGAGTAYALPTSHISLANGSSTIELGFNIFDMTVSTRATDDASERLLAQADVRNKTRSDALDALARADAEQESPLFESGATAKSDVGDPELRKKLEQRAEQAFKVETQRAPKTERPSKAGAEEPDPDSSQTPNQLEGEPENAKKDMAKDSEHEQQGNSVATAKEKQRESAPGEDQKPQSERRSVPVEPRSQDK